MHWSPLIMCTPQTNADRGSAVDNRSLKHLIQSGLVAGLLLGLTAACGTVKSNTDDAGSSPTDAALERDAGPDAVVDAPDAMPEPVLTKSREVVGAGGRVTSATYTFDVELGLPIDHRPARGTTHTLEVNSVIKP